MTKVVKRVLVGTGIVVGGLLCVAAAVIGLYLYVTRPISDGERLGGGPVTAVVTGHVGPIKVPAYLFELADGSLGLVDTGDDQAAASLDAALSRLGKTRASVRAILATHSHGDHAGGVLAFPDAVLYGIAPDVESVRGRRERAGATGETRTVSDGERLDVRGTPVEVFALPGHTQGSAAYLVHGVLFLGDTAHSMRDGTLGPNEMFSDDADAAVRTLKSLAERLKGRTDVRQIAFGHSGPLDGLDPLLAWASGS